jgi:hypothetical protein
MAFKEIQQSFPTEGDSLNHSRLVQNYEGILYFQADSVVDASHKGKQTFPSRNTEDYADEIKVEFSNYLAQFKQLKRE